MNRSHVIVNSMIVLSCLAFLFTPVSAQDQSDHTARLIEGAKKEKKLVWYTSMTLPNAMPLLESFKLKHPFVQVDYLRAGGEATLNRILTETRVGKWEFDVVSVTQMETLLHHQVLAPYRSPESKSYIAEFQDSAGYWTGIAVNYYAIGYNTKLVSESEAPKRWEDLLDRKWKGKISIDREEYAWYAALLSSWGKERTRDYMESLAKQDIQWRKNHVLMAQLMAAGEFPVAIIYAHTIEEMKRRGAPVEWVNTLDPIVASIQRIALGRKPTHPHAAKLFIDFVLSKEGQEIIRSRGRVPARSDVEPLSSRMLQSQLRLRGVPSDIEIKYREYQEEFKRIFGLS
jgi:iron(III) transport system substrate-binding protein